MLKFTQRIKEVLVSNQTVCGIMGNLESSSSQVRKITLETSRILTLMKRHELNRTEKEIPGH